MNWHEKRADNTVAPQNWERAESKIEIGIARRPSPTDLGVPFVVAIHLRKGEFALGIDQGVARDLRGQRFLAAPALAQAIAAHLV